MILVCTIAVCARVHSCVPLKACHATVPHFCWQGDTVLHSAASNQCPMEGDAADVVELLLLKGADVHAKDKNVSGHLDPEKYILDVLSII